ncbi:uncharacterized protein LOC62_05G007258 [Vanrija pseudolonga]|uniref:Uncharacterized protein n=1 Tax=Vanrija pseudolonga TaxID=143232 RepID=A0AAF0YC43_9TREE|nr:hypothetical protein LOC62_05G007258 [Vanrija pseudolonga]
MKLLLLTALVVLAGITEGRPALPATATGPTPAPARRDADAAPTPTDEFFTSTLRINSFGGEWYTSVRVPPESETFVWTAYAWLDDGSRPAHRAAVLLDAMIASSIAGVVLCFFVGLPLVVWYRGRPPASGGGGGATAPAPRRPSSPASSTSSRKLLVGAAAAAATALPKAAAAPLRRALVTTTMTVYAVSTDSWGDETHIPAGMVRTTLRVPDTTVTLYPETAKAAYIKAMRQQRLYGGMIGLSWAAPFVLVLPFLLYYFLKLRRWRKMQRAQQGVPLDTLHHVEPGKKVDDE